MREALVRLLHPKSAVSVDMIDFPMNKNFCCELESYSSEILLDRLVRTIHQATTWRDYKEASLCVGERPHSSRVQ